MSPIFIGVFLRMYWLILAFFYGGVCYLIFGSKSTEVIGVLSFLTALVFTVATIRWIYIQFKKHIIEES